MSSQLGNHLYSTEVLFQKEYGSGSNAEHCSWGVSLAWSCPQRLDRGQTRTLPWNQCYYLSQGPNASIPFPWYGSLIATRGFSFHSSPSIFMGNRAHSLRSMWKIALLTQSQEQNLHDHLNPRKIQDQTALCWHNTKQCLAGIPGYNLWNFQGISQKTELHFFCGFFFRVSMILGSHFAK